MKGQLTIQEKKCLSSPLLNCPSALPSCTHRHTTEIYAADMQSVLRKGKQGATDDAGRDDAV